MRREEGAEELNHDDLQRVGQDEHEPEHAVLENALEHVHLVVDAARVELVEQLQTHEHVEHHRVVLRRHVPVPQLHSDRHVEHPVTVEHDREQDRHVEEHLHQQVTNDHVADQTLVLAVRRAVQQDGRRRLGG